MLKRLHLCSLPLLATLLALTAFPSVAQDASGQNRLTQNRLTVDWIWTARYVVTSGDNPQVIENGAVAIQGDQIVAVGPQADVEAAYASSKRLDQPNAILAPGLINTHTHAAMSLFRGVANDRALEDWLENYIFPAEAMNVDRDFVEWGTRLALLEMALSGTTTFTDMYYFEDTVAEVTKQAGLRGVLGQTVIGFPAPDYATPQEALAAAASFLDKYANDPLITPAVAPHAIYTTPDDVLKESRAVANRFGAPMLIHLAETKTEYDDAVAMRGMTPVAAASALGLLDGATVAAHGIWLDDADFDLLAAAGTGVAHNPSSNMMLASGIAPIPKMLARGIAVGLGTDGPAGSNNDFDMIEEMDVAAKLQKVATGDPSAISAQDVFTMATSMGARVLGLQDQIGSIEKGKRADLISVRIDAPHAVPAVFAPSEVYAALVYSLKASDVSEVMVNGQLIVSDHQMLTLDAEEILLRAAGYREKVRRSLNQQANQ